MKTKSTIKAIGASVLALSLAFCGCRDKRRSESGSGSESNGGLGTPTRVAFKPMVGKDADFAVGVNLDKKQMFKVLDANADWVFDAVKAYGNIDDKKIAEAKEKLAAFKKDPFAEMPEGMRKFLKRSGLRDVELRWAVLSLEGFEIVDDKPRLGGLSLAIAGRIDLDKFISAIREDFDRDEVAFEKTQVDGEAAWHIVPKKAEGVTNLKEVHVDPYVMSLDGRLVLLATSRETLVRQVRLYRTGEGRGDALGGFSAAEGDWLHLHLSNVGSFVRKYVPSKQLKIVNNVIPDGEQLLLGLGDLDVDDGVLPNGVLNSSLSLSTASKKDADSLRTFAKVGLASQTARIVQDPNTPDVVKKIVQDVKIGGTDSQYKVWTKRIPVGASLLGLPMAALFPAVSSAMRNANLNAMSIQGRKLIMGIVMANIDRQGKADPVWPMERDADSSSDEEDLDVASKCGSATEYFNALFDMEHYGTAKWEPAVDGELLSTLGKDAVVDKKIRAAGLDWCIALNIQDETPDYMPVLISANFNPKLLVPGVFSGRDDRLLPIGPQSGAAKSMFGDEAVVVVRKSGVAEVIKKKNLTLTVLYNRQSFDNTSSSKQIKWLTPTGVVTPVGHK